MISASDLMLWSFNQNLHGAHGYICFYCCIFIHLSMYAIVIMVMDDYVRIKHYANFKKFWITKLLLAFISIAAFLFLLQAIMMLISSISREEYVVILVYFEIDGAVISIYICSNFSKTNIKCYILQIKNYCFKTESIDKKISELCMRNCVKYVNFT